MATRGHPESPLNAKGARILTVRLTALKRGNDDRYMADIAARWDNVPKWHTPSATESPLVRKKRDAPTCNACLLRFHVFAVSAVLVAGHGPATRHHSGLGYVGANRRHGAGKGRREHDGVSVKAHHRLQK